MTLIFIGKYGRTIIITKENLLNLRRVLSQIDETTKLDIKDHC